MADQLPAWFIHAVSDNIIHLGQQKQTMGMAAVTVREGVVGKTYPFQRMAKVAMVQNTVRDGDTVYINPTLSKRRANLIDFIAAMLIDEFDEIKTLNDPKSEFAQSLAWARNRTLDELLLSVPGLGTAGAAGVAVGGILGLATVVDEALETATATALPSAQQIVDGGTNLTMAKILDAKVKMDEASIDTEDRYFFYSPKGMRKLLTDTTVISSDYSTVQALTTGGFPMDRTWVGFKWRESVLLPITGNIRSCIAVQKSAVGMAVGLLKNVEIDKAVHKNNNDQVLMKLSAGAVRREDAGVVQVNIDETA